MCLILVESRSVFASFTMWMLFCNVLHAANAFLFADENLVFMQAGHCVAIVAV